MKISKLLILVFLFAMPVFAVQQPAAVSISINPNNITLSVGEGVNMNVTLLNDGQPVTDAYFTLSGIDLDIGESQYYMGNGIYNVSILPSQTTAMLPGTYNVIITAHYGSSTTSGQIVINVTSDDTVTPHLTIIQPDPDTFNQTVFYLKIMGTDETQWYDFNVSIGGHTIYYLVNPYPYEENRGTFLQTNKTYLSYGDWYNLKDIKDTLGFLNNKIIISIRDTNLNTNQTIMLLDGDYEAPIITWTSHSYGQQIKNRQITLSWQITDNSSIAELKLYFNGTEFFPNGNQITTNTSTVSFFLAIPKDQASFITFTLKAVDAAGNRAESSLLLIYDTSAYVTTPSPIVRVMTEPDTAYALYGAVAVFIVTAIILFKKLEFSSTNKKAKFSKKIIATAVKELTPLTTSPEFKQFPQQWQDIISEKIKITTEAINNSNSSTEISNAKMNLRTQLDTIILQIQDTDKNVKQNVLISYMRIYNQVL